MPSSITEEWRGVTSGQRRHGAARRLGRRAGQGADQESKSVKPKMGMYVPNVPSRLDSSHDLRPHPFSPLSFASAMGKQLALLANWSVNGPYLSTITSDTAMLAARASERASERVRCAYLSDWIDLTSRASVRPPSLPFDLSPRSLQLIGLSRAELGWSGRRRRRRHRETDRWSWKGTEGGCDEVSE